MVARRLHDLRFRHLCARTQRLANTALFLFSILWDSLPISLRNNLILIINIFNSIISIPVIYVTNQICDISPENKNRIAYSQ